MIRSAGILVILGTAVAAVCCASSAPEPSVQQEPRWGIVVHTGAGDFTLESLGDRREPMRAAMAEALEAAYEVLAADGSSLDAVQAAVVMLEDSPLFNAGRGAVFTHDGRHELDASIMDGATRRAGAVAGVSRIRNPVILARHVMDHSPHVMLTGAGAEAFAAERGGVEFVNQDFFYTERAWQALQRVREREQQTEQPGASSSPAMERDMPAGYFGTVGAVALDRHGNLAAATSTGGMTNKRAGRVGDSPVIGAGTYASERCAVSATGHGEYFIRYAVAHDICARVEYCELAVQDAADAVIHGVLAAAGGNGGVIALDRLGRVAMSFNVTGMGRGYIGPDKVPVVMFTARDALDGLNGHNPCE
jgi:L-asparaginase / beta-aspartyl-peptidase